MIDSVIGNHDERSIDVYLGLLKVVSHEILTADMRA